MEWLTEFFATIPEALSALWSFGRGWVGLAITIGSAVLTGLCLLGAQRTRETAGWVSATLGGVAATIAGFWAFGILPSAWVYFADQARDTLLDQIIPSQIAVPWPGRDEPFVVVGNFYQVFRDSIVMVETFVAMAAFTVAALMIQKRYPRTLAEGEEARPQSGGYK